ncbi:MAG: hypothetical protein ACD_62C00642G0001, partial [uncultured bacterium]
MLSISQLPHPVRETVNERGLSPHDALQAFLQFLVIKHHSFEPARFIGGTALVLGHGNPRFSEDIDFT